MSTDLAGIDVFVMVAEERSFRAASQRLGVTRSAVSQTLRRLEDRLGISLVQRTTRSMRLTEAGERLFHRVRPALAEIGTALDAVGELRGRPTGLLRLTVSSIAESFLRASTLTDFLGACPDVRLDLTISDDEQDIVAQGFDAGVRLGEVIAQDMIAVAVSGKQRQVVVGSPDYVRRRGVPRHPRDLTTHTCIGWRPSPGVAPYRWEFTAAGRDFDVAVDPRVTTNDMGVMIRLACAGAGLTFGMEETFQPYLARGELVSMLERFSSPFPGFYLYYPSRSHQPLKLRALVEYLQQRMRPSRARARPRT